MSTPETPLQALDWLVGSSMHPHVVEIHQRAEIIRKALSREPVSAAAPGQVDRLDPQPIDIPFLHGQINFVLQMARERKHPTPDQIMLAETSVDLFAELAGRSASSAASGGKPCIPRSAVIEYLAQVVPVSFDEECLAHIHDETAGDVAVVVVYAYAVRVKDQT